jgi:4-amino-4-deoxy-L-arabinose transferase-like glycosyltransferase
MTTTSTESAPAVASPATRVALALLILAACLLAASTWRIYSNTWDEPEHLAAGIELLDKGRYEYDTEHPPIVRALMALGPYLAGARSFGTPPPDGVQEGVDILYTGGHYDLYLTLARLGTLPFLVMLLFCAWLWARRLTRSEGEALLAVLLLASVPPVLGHAALATLDVAAAGTVLLALYALQCWLDSARWRDAVFFGVTAGVAVGAKFSAIPFLVLGSIVLAGAQWVVRRGVAGGAGERGVGAERGAVVHSGAGAGGVAAAERGVVAQGGVGAGHVAAAERGGPALTVVEARQVDVSVARTRLIGVALIVVMAMVPLAIAYGVRSPGANVVAHKFDWAIVFLQHERGISHDAGVLLQHLWLPTWVKGFFEGIIALKAHNDSGHLSFLLGQQRSTGWWYFYLVALAAKTPIPLLVCGPIGMVALAREGWQARDAWRLAPLVLFLTLLAFASAFSHINIGIRHVLVLYPFMALGGAHLLALAWGVLRKAALGPLAVVGQGVLVVLVGWQVLTLWTAHPDYLPYFNEAVAHPERVLVDSDLDWGQDLRRLEQRAAEIRIPKLNLAYRGTANLARESLPPFVIMPPWKPVTGWVAISALAVVHDPKGYAWLDAYKPLELVGKTIELYYIPPARP